VAAARRNTRPAATPSARRRGATLGARLRAAREAAGLTQQALAAASGVSQRMISSVELDSTDVSVSKLRALADALRVSLDHLVPPGAAG
jgi:transcriptional regulator with XRE-family HTH domain